MDNAEWNAKKGGLEKALEELYKEGGAFDGIITSVVKKKGGKPTPMTFPIKGRSRETWIDDVKFGIEGKGRKDKETGEDVATFVTKGIEGILRRFEPETDLQGKESLSAWVNRQYQFRRGDVFNHYEKNPTAVSYDKLVSTKTGKTLVGDLADVKNVRTEIFEEQDLSQRWIKNKKAKFKEVATIDGERKLENEIPVDKKEFEKKDGWKQTIIKNIPNIKK